MLNAIDQNDKKSIMDRYNKHNEEIESAKDEIKDWLSEREEEKTQALQNENLINPEDSISCVPSNTSKSRHSKTSSVRSASSSLRLKLAEQRAKRQADEAFEAQKKMLEEANRQRDLEKQKQKIEMERQHQLKIIEQKFQEEQEKTERENKLRELEKQRSLRFEENLEKEISALEDNVSRSQVKSTNRSLSRRKTLPKTNVSEIVSGGASIGASSQATHTDSFLNVLAKQNEISVMLLKNQEKLSLPKNEPERFDGSNLLKFPSFIRAFKSMIEDHCDNDLDRLQYLEKYTLGLPLQLVRSCRNNSPSEGYKNAIKLLEKEFGNEFRIAMAYIEELEKWPNVKSDDGKAMQELSIFLTCIANEMSNNLTSYSQLNSPQEIKKIIDKLPYKLRDQWRTNTHGILQQNRNVEFKDLCTFMNQQASRLTQPIFGNISDAKDGKHNVNDKSSGAKKKIFATSSQESKTKNCICCKKDNHRLNKCFFFEKKTHDDKVKFIKENKLCFACLEANHNSKNCKSRLTCKKCQGQHPSVLHRDFKAGQRTSTSVEEAKKINLRMNLLSRKNPRIYVKTLKNHWL